MSVRFFGQFLLDEGEIDSDHLRDAVRLMQRSNRSLGEVAVEAGFASSKAVEQVSRAQLRSKRSFGETAIECGVLDPQSLDACLRVQESNRLRIGEALVKLGHLPEDRLGVLLDRFKSEQAAYRTDAVPLPDGLDGDGLVRSVVELTPKLLDQVTDLSVELGPAREITEGPRHALVASVRIAGAGALDLALDLGLNADRRFAETIAAAIFGADPRTLDLAMIQDGLGEFLNMLAGNAVSLVEGDGVEFELDPPRAELRSQGGHAFALLTKHGEADLLIQRGDA